jgi:tRNA (5-methylaminomethyl-2-thiouridylate)-methyltransferase
VKVAVLLSGGVDSSVALRLLQEQGHRITAFYLKVWLAGDLLPGACPWEEDLRYARSVCRQAGVPLRVVPVQREYFSEVVSEAVSELAAGATPSPDLLCNSRIKFGAFFSLIDPSFQAVATGHYARVEAGGDGPRLRRSPDAVKDQTYFLARLTGQQLGRVLFPIGGMTKSQVRALAARYGLATRDRPDSQGICFLGRIRFREFLRAFLGEQPGRIVESESGRVLGTHRGCWYYTIGQRTGLGLSGGPWYVVGKDSASGTVAVAHGRRLASFQRRRFRVRRMHWISGAAPAADGPWLVRIRHGPALLPALLEGRSPNTLPPAGEEGVVNLEEGQSGIAPGQYAVFYRGERCLGCAVIAEGEVPG